jgi:hypothetical protein
VQGRHTDKAAVIHLRLTWGTRKVHLAARFGGAVFLGAAFLALLGIIVLHGQHWLGR